MYSKQIIDCLCLCRLRMICARMQCPVYGHNVWLPLWKYLHIYIRIYDSTYLYTYDVICARKSAAALHWERKSSYGRKKKKIQINKQQQKHILQPVCLSHFIRVALFAMHFNFLNTNILTFICFVFFFWILFRS